MKRVNQVRLWTLLASLLAGPLPAQEASAPRPTGDCVVTDGRAAADGSCGHWTAKQKIATARPISDGKKVPDVSSKRPLRNQLKIATIIDFEQLTRITQIGSALSQTVYVCVKAPHDAHAEDVLVISTTFNSTTHPSKFCEQHSLNGDECTKQASLHDLDECKKAQASKGWLPDKTYRWCIGRKADPSCRYISLYAGQKLSVWITRLKPPTYYAVNRSASGTWHLVK